MAYLARLLVTLCISVQAASVVRLYPFDDTDRDSSFRAYVGRLRTAVHARDTEALRKLVDDEVVVGPAKDDKGWTKFVARWPPDDGPLWNALADLLSLGFVREHPTLYLSPYLVWRFPRDLNMATHLVVVRDKAVLREAPSLTAAAVASLSFDVVRRLGQPENSDELIQWVRVQTLDDKTGYVNARDVMSPIMPRAQFAQKRGRWTMVALEGP